LNDTLRWCVLIPCLNEEAAIHDVVQSVLALGVPVIVIDDGSDDHTPEIVSELPVTLLRHPQRLGKGEALRSGFREALKQGFEAVLTMDGDGQHLASDVPRIVAAARSNQKVGTPPMHLPTGAFPGPARNQSPTPKVASAGTRARHWIWLTCRRRTLYSKRRF